jgi:hypothetical protein
MATGAAARANHSSGRNMADIGAVSAPLRQWRAACYLPGGDLTAYNTDSAVSWDTESYSLHLQGGNVCEAANRPLLVWLTPRVWQLGL